MMNRTIATLTGKLKFDVDQSGFKRFEALMKRAQTQMENLNKEMNKKFDNGRSAAKAKHTRALDRELQAERAVEASRRRTFAAELQRQKLTYAGKKSEQKIETAITKQKQQQAVAAAKAQRATELASGRGRGRPANAETAAIAAKMRQARYEILLNNAKARTDKAKEDSMRRMTALERAQVALQGQKQRVATQAISTARRDQQQRNAEVRRNFREQSRVQNSAVRAERQTERHQWAQARQQQWQANSSRGGVGGSGVLGALGLDVGPVSGALGGLAAAAVLAGAALYAVGARLEKKESDVKKAQSFNLSLQTAGGANIDNQHRARDAYVAISQKYGTAMDNESASDFSNFVQGMTARGNSLDKSIEVYESQQATFRGAGLDRDRQKRAALQLSQIRGKGKPDGEDVNTLTESLGSPVMQEIKKAARDRTGAKVSDADIDGWFRKEVTKGNIKASDFDKGMSNYVTNNQGTISAQMNSVDAMRTRQQNLEMIQDNALSSDPALIGANKELIAAQTDLTAAMLPLKEAVNQLDTAMMSAAANATQAFADLLRIAMGTDKERTDQEKAEMALTTNDLAVDTKMVGVGDYSDIDPSKIKHTGKIDKFYDWVFGNDVDANSNQESVSAVLNNSAGLTGILGAELTPAMAAQMQGKSSVGLPNNLSDTIDAEDRLGLKSMGFNDQSSRPPAVVNITAPITIHAEGMTPEQAETMAKGIVHEEMGKVFQSINSNQTEGEQ